MVNYQNGKIYQIICHTTSKCYIGSTCAKTLAYRLSGHVSQYKHFLETGTKYISSIEVLQNNNYEILLLEEYPCHSKDQLHARERFYTQSLECVNKRKNQGIIAELGHDEYQKYIYNSNKEEIKKRVNEYRLENKETISIKKKEYQEKNKEVISKKSKQRYQKNRDDIIQRVKEYAQNNPEKIKERNKDYRERNKEAIKERKSRPYTCPCGSCCTIVHKARHERSIKHQNYLKSLGTVEIP